MEAETSVRLPELKTDKGIQGVVEYLKSGKVPKGSNKAKYDERYGKESGFHVKDGKLYRGKQAIVALNDATDVNRHKTNHYPEFQTAKGIKKVIQFIKSGKEPVETWRKKFDKESSFHVKNGKLFQGALEVVFPADRQKAIESIYNDDTKGLGVGLQQFYQQVCSKYLNVFKKDTDEFLQKQGDYKIGVVPHRKHMSIVAKRPAERWGVDLIDMTMYPAGSNHFKKYIMTVVDYFSNKVWARGIANRENGLEISVQQANDDLREFPNEVAQDVQPERVLEEAQEVEPEIEPEPEPEPLAPKKAPPPLPMLRRPPSVRAHRNQMIRGGADSRKKLKRTPKAEKVKKILTTKFLNMGLNPEDEFKRIAEEKKQAPEIQKKQKQAKQAKKKEALGETVRYTDDTLRQAFESIIEEAGVKPHFIQSDNEFNKGSFKQYCDQNNIKTIFALSHQSFTTGRVERMNKELRKKMKAGFIRHNNLVWYGDDGKVLQSYCDNINNQKAARTGLSPNDLWGSPETENTPKQKRIQEAHKNYIVDEAKAINNRYKDNFKVGDEVRVKLTSILPKVRRTKKSNFGWNVMAVHWSPEIYRIREKLHYPKSSTKQDEYILENIPHDHDEEPEPLFKYTKIGKGEIKNLSKTPSKFRASDLILIPADSNETSLDPETWQRSQYINRIKNWEDLFSWSKTRISGNL